MKISLNGKNQLIKHEGIRYEMYYDVAGLPTIAIGHLINLKTEKHLLTKKLTNREVMELLNKDLLRFENNINKVVKVPLNQNQFDVLVSFSFNIGINAFNQSSLLRVLNQGNYEEVGNQLMRWNKAVVNGKLQPVLGLTNRRKDEVKLFNTPVTNEINYKDVKKSDWFYESVKWATEVGLSKGYPDGTFRPNKPLTRAEIFSILKKFKELY